MDNSPIRVLHICQRDDPASGGAVRVAIEYVTRLQDYGVDAHCLFLYGEPGYFQDRLYRSAHYLDIQSSKEIWKLGRLLKFIWKFKPDIVHHHDGLMWSNLLTTIHPGYSKVSHAHLGPSIHTSPFKGTLAAWLQRRSVNALICIANSIRTDYLIQSCYPEVLTHVIYNGVDTRRFRPVSERLKRTAKQRFGWYSETPTVGYVGRLECKMKGVDDFLRVLAELPTDVKGLVVGDGPDREKLEAMAQQHNLTDRIHFTGNLSEPYDAYCAIDVFCLTSHHEPFGLTIVEAMSCGIPVVGFACEGGVNEILNESTGCIVADRIPKEMAREIVNILKIGISPSKQTSIRKKLTENYCWDRNTQELAKLYRAVAQ